MNKFDKLKQSLPKILKVGTNPIITALIKALASEGEDLAEALEKTKAQLFVKTAEGKYLDALGGDFGVKRPIVLGMTDPDFRELIPNFSIKAKQIRKAFYDTMRIFWGDFYQKSNLTSVNLEPYDVYPGETLIVKIDNGNDQVVEILADDLKLPGFAEASELVEIFNSRFKHLTASEIEDPTTGTSRINLMTNTSGALGSIQVMSSSTMVGLGKLDFDITKSYNITDLSQRTVIYEVNPGEVIIELPAIIPTLRRVLKGSHHFHLDATLEAPFPPENGIYQGSFFYAPIDGTFSIGSVKCKLQDPVLAGNVYTSITTDAVEDASEFPNESGWLIFNFGMESEYPVRYLSRPNDRTLLIDPSYTFQKTHISGSYVNILRGLSAYIPTSDGNDLSVYMTSPSSARSEVQELLSTLVASGIKTTFVILLPSYHWVQDNDNPYL